MTTAPFRFFTQATTRVRYVFDFEVVEVKAEMMLKDVRVNLHLNLRYTRKDEDPLSTSV